MKTTIQNLFRNQLFILLINGVFAYTAFCAIIMATINVPPEEILESNLQEIILVFEDYD